MCNDISLEDDQSLLDDLADHLIPQEGREAKFSNPSRASGRASDMNGLQTKIYEKGMDSTWAKTSYLFASELDPPSFGQGDTIICSRMGDWVD
jgi:hypothetical protein